MGALLHDQEIACQQALVEDSSVFSIQWSLFPACLATELSPETLLSRYLSYIRRCTISIIRPCMMPTGVEFRLLGSRLSLISFLPPVTEGTSVALRICGGLLVQPRQCERGEMRFGVEEQPEGVRVSLLLSDYCPLLLGSSSPSTLRRWFYRITQATIHRLVTVRFLILLRRDLTGAKARIKVVNVTVRDGRPT